MPVPVLPGIPALQEEIIACRLCPRLNEHCAEMARVKRRAYLDWEYGLVGQLARDGTHGFFVI